MRSAAVICEICNEQAQNEDCPPIIRAISNEMIENPMVHEVIQLLIINYFSFHFKPSID